MTQPTSAPNIRLELLSNPLYLSGVREFVSGVAKRVGFNEVHCSQIALAVDEAMANIIRHGYDARTDGKIWIEVTHEGDAKTGLRMQVVIEDEARQVDPRTIKSRDLEDIRPGGLGVHIIKEVMDVAMYEKCPGNCGMRLTLVKTQQPSTPLSALSGVGPLGVAAGAPAVPPSAGQSITNQSPINQATAPPGSSFSNVAPPKGHP